ncbi:hypothetical protein [Demequina iriomotensis]|uniref:hypothetical protein n=1 Tax=Demequina iriomotensis TaxID=1536641 RepID=UPI0007851C68|nr:hypothetical protein [Demequina iriomotensis]
MGIIDDIKRENTAAQVEASAHDAVIAAAVSDALEPIAIRVRDLTDAVNALTTRVGEAASEPSSGLDDLDEIKRTLVLMSETLTSSKAVQLPNGRRITRRDLEAHELMLEVTARMEALESTGRVVLDANKVASAMATKVTGKLDEAVLAALRTHERQLTSIVRQAADTAAEPLTDAVARAERLERVLTRSHSTVRWHTVGRVAIALLPVCTAVILVASATGVVSEVFGVGSLFGWAWSTFDAATVWWHKALIAAGTLGAAAMATWRVVAGSRWLYNRGRGW